MDILWVALGICVIVGFVFVILARHWQRLLAHQAWVIRRLTDRLQSVEEIADPNFRRKLDLSAPSPLEQVYTFGLRLADSFWRNTLQVTESESEYVREHGNFLGSVKIERWRSHTVVTVTEVLPQSKSASWQTRSFDIFPDSRESDARPITLWQLPLAEEKSAPETGQIPTLELRWNEGALELCARYDRFVAAHDDTITLAPLENIFFTVPLDAERLAAFRKPEETPDSDVAQVLEKISDDGASGRGRAWMAFYGQQNDEVGYEWNLCLRDLLKRADWERWKVIEPEQIIKVKAG